MRKRIETTVIIVPFSALAVAVSADDSAQCLERFSDRNAFLEEMAVHIAFGDDAFVGRANVRSLREIRADLRVIFVDRILFTGQGSGTETFAKHSAQRKHLRKMFGI